MTDIVKRLREPPFGTETSERNLMSDAADDITRLRAENERLKRSRDRYRAAWEEEKRRFTAARAALEEK
jgi:hypothetical protein